MKKLLIIFILILSITKSFGLQHQNTSDSLDCKVDSMQSLMIQMIDSLENQDIKINQLRALIINQKGELSDQKEILLSQKGIVDTAFSGVSNQISAASYLVGGFGIIIVFVSLALGVWISRKERIISRILNDSEVLLQKNVSIKKEVEDFGEKIVSDTKGLYKLIQNEESEYILERLISVPEDIANLFYNLASRDLEVSHFELLKEAAMQVIGDKDTIEEGYSLLFFQHFAGKSLSDKDIKPIMLNNLKNNFEGAFKNDMIRSTSDFFKEIVKIGIEESKGDINKFIYELQASKYAGTEEIYSIIFSVLQIRENQFGFYDQIDKNKQTSDFRGKFGKLLLNYKNEELEETEGVVITEIESLNK